MSDSGVVEFGEMEEALQSHLALLRADLADEVSFLSCQLKSERSFVELNFGFTLRSDQMLRQHVVTMGSLSMTKAPQRLRYLEAAFRFIRQIVDESKALQD